MEIAQAAATLFVRHGLRNTRAEDIAQAAGIAPRTFYRYFASKEEAVAPLYAAGAQLWTAAVHHAPASLTIPEALRHAVDQTLAPGSGLSASSWEWARTLIHLADTSPALRKVWAEVCQAAEEELAPVLAVRLASARGASASAASVDNVAETGTADADAHALLPADATVTPHLRFAAAVACAAVRVAVEAWAATTSPHTGPGGPAALALRNLTALGDFGWGGSA
ncbi:TetR/AcrR family transcriptional regulator [Streptomyces sp. NBC_00820]|uniref:TetR/AcrR family transcriptional regulator n=1 Tax=Streptomyces sp. NBC_00820 TaxID=2975842 RepID=UPI002ED22654|nr:TetR/AcrR family transcriptional regulator [Streptomyces sp. NBC_00820]